MAKLARDYHYDLQLQDLWAPNTADEYTRCLNNTLNEIAKSHKLCEPDRTTLNWYVTKAQVTKAINLSKNGLATGIDGCPYELWKTLLQCHNKAQQSNSQGFDIVTTLTNVFNNIQMHRMHPDSNFAQGWMYPIFKKKDPTLISNYCPITPLNTDYKLLTKVLALQLIEHAHTLINEDQAGFIPK